MTTPRPTVIREIVCLDEPVTVQNWVGQAPRLSRRAPRPPNKTVRTLLYCETSGPFNSPGEGARPTHLQLVSYPKWLVAP